MARSFWLKLWAALVFAYLYLPILVLVVFSFNSQKLNLQWQSFTLRWYGVLFADERLREATFNSLIVAIAATLLSTILGTLLALALERYRAVRPAELLLYTAIIVPDVVLGIALLIWFSRLGWPSGLVTIAAGHVVLCTPFVALTVRARLADYDPALEEAAMDLGAKELTTFWRVTLPAIGPGVLAGALLAFTLSLDDYVVALFTAGPGSTTLPLRIFSMVRFSITPEINALSTLWIGAVSLLLFAGQVFARRARTRL
ncbi:ABC transporter permease [Gloeobacter kilaueensis]|uniref:Binding-protein-dependent transport systems inner membrane component n=1 Tax=Gloeobacter kilaueensis (strain ATCC BAA-2537 / CCAP 1431/1 / ULC 316 / JS1) TaxID=1183438 RepID=U5QJ97_GLOK1|nr:ABC transporter permease [Gloeobacter kilaueensis]AGY58986.1 binding-protein-dependent transport systems inner membrane component [Gloeobacter kilaueensis JS1]